MREIPFINEQTARMECRNIRCQYLVVIIELIIIFISFLVFNYFYNKNLSPKFVLYPEIYDTEIVCTCLKSINSTLTCIDTSFRCKPKNNFEFFNAEGQKLVIEVHEFIGVYIIFFTLLLCVFLVIILRSCSVENYVYYANYAFLDKYILNLNEFDELNKKYQRSNNINKGVCFIMSMYFIKCLMITILLFLFFSIHLKDYKQCEDTNSNYTLLSDLIPIVCVSKGRKNNSYYPINSSCKFNSFQQLYNEFGEPKCYEHKNINRILAFPFLGYLILILAVSTKWNTCEYHDGDCYVHSFNYGGDSFGNYLLR